MKVNKWAKNCPGCGTEQCYSSKYELKSARETDRVCKSCSWDKRRKKTHSKRMRGKNNPFYKKTHTDDVIELLKENRKKLDMSFMQTKTYKKIMSDVNKGRKLSTETKDKIRKKALGRVPTKTARKNMRIAWLKKKKWITKNGGQFSPGYNPEACKIIENYGKENGYNFQHAENGGEYHIKELGYWADGYDEEKNVVIEYYEPFHKKQIERDERRKQEIIDLLGCKFIEIREH